MISLALFVGVGALLFLTLFLLLRQKPAAEGGAVPAVQAQEALLSLEDGLLPPEIVERIFDPADLAYVTANSPREVHELFWKERQRIAISWVRIVEKHVQSLRRFHRTAARQYSHLSFRSEAALAFDFVTLLFACRALRVLLFLRGPFAAPRVVGATVAAATRVCEASKQSMAFLTPASIAAVGNGAGGATAP
jgi:hypothetical protein